MPAAGAIEVRGIVELQRSFGKYGKDLKKGLRRELGAVAEPVRFDASNLARSEIRNMTLAWSQMRVGITKGTIVYVAPVKRGSKTGPQKRRNLGDLLMQKALQPALERNRTKIEAGMEKMLDVVAGENGFLV
jgi:hypothetical protein